MRGPLAVLAALRRLDPALIWTGLLWFAVWMLAVLLLAGMGR